MRAGRRSSGGRPGANLVKAPGQKKLLPSGPFTCAAAGPANRPNDSARRDSGRDLRRMFDASRATGRPLHGGSCARDARSCALAAAAGTERGTEGLNK